MKSENGSEMRTEIKGLTTAQRQPQDAPRRVKAPKLGPTWSHEGSQNQFEIEQNSILGAQGGSKATEDPPETPNRPKSIPNRPQMHSESTRSWNAKDS